MDQQAGKSGGMPLPDLFIPTTVVEFENLNKEQVRKGACPRFSRRAREQAVDEW